MGKNRSESEGQFALRALREDINAQLKGDRAIPRKGERPAHTFTFNSHQQLPVIVRGADGKIRIPPSSK